ncbi:MAG: hypothetical protein AB7V48_18215, partial [Sedimentibacter sp.]
LCLHLFYIELQLSEFVERSKSNEALALDNNFHFQIKNKIIWLFISNLYDYPSFFIEKNDIL